MQLMHPFFARWKIWDASWEKVAQTGSPQPQRATTLTMPTALQTTQQRHLLFWGQGQE